MITLSGKRRLAAAILVTSLSYPVWATEVTDAQKSSPEGKAQKPLANCDTPEWMTPPESHDGVFQGNLKMTCRLAIAAGTSIKELPFEALKTGIIQKIQSESVIHSGPIEVKLNALPALQWDVTHHIQEDGNAVKIREEAILQTDKKAHLLYQTHSKEVSASNMAQYLEAVNFSLQVDLEPTQVLMQFKNEVRVRRPWYALDLLFAPIASHACLSKMEVVQNKLLPWVTSFIE